MPELRFFRHLPIDEVAAKIDWLITRGYMAIRYDYRLPLLVYTQMGWEIEKETFVDEIFREIKTALEGHGEFPMGDLKEGNREIHLLFLEKIEATGDGKYIPFLETWQVGAFKKMRVKINRVINGLRNSIS